MYYLLESPQDPTSKNQKKNSTIIKLSNKKTFEIVKDICDLNNIDVEFKITDEGKFLCIPMTGKENIIGFKKIIKTLKYSIDEDITYQELNDIINFIYKEGLYSEETFKKNPSYKKGTMIFNHVKIGNNLITEIEIELDRDNAASYLSNYKGGASRISNALHLFFNPADDSLFDVFIHEYSHLKQFKNKNDNKEKSIITFLHKYDNAIKNNKASLKEIFKIYQVISKIENEQLFGNLNPYFIFKNFDEFLETIAVLEKKHIISYDEDDFKTIIINDLGNYQQKQEEYKKLYETNEHEVLSHIRGAVIKLLIIEKIKFNENTIKEYYLNLNDEFYFYNKFIAEPFQKILLTSTELDLNRLKNNYDFRLKNNVVLKLKEMNPSYDLITYGSKNNPNNEEISKYNELITELVVYFANTTKNTHPPKKLISLFNSLGYDTTSDFFNKNFKIIFKGFYEIEKIIENSDKLNNNLKHFVNLNEIVEMIKPTYFSIKNWKDERPLEDKNKEDEEENIFKNNMMTQQNKEIIKKILDEKSSELINEFIDNYSERYFNSLINHHPKFKNLNQEENQKLKSKIKLYITKMYNKIYDQMKNEFDKMGEPNVNLLKKMYGLSENIIRKSLLKNYINLIIG